MGRRRAWATVAVAAVVLGVLVACSDDGGDAGDAEREGGEDAVRVVDDLADLEALRAGSEAQFATFADDAGAVGGVTGAFPVGEGGVEGFLAEHAGLLGLDQPGIDLVPVSDGAPLDDDGATVVRYRQTYRGVPVAGGDLVVATEGDVVRTIIGGGLPPLAMEVRPVLPPTRAVDAAVAAAGGGSARTAPELVIVDRSDDDSGQPPSFVLAWRVLVAAPGGAHVVDVDATTIDASVLRAARLDAEATPDDLDVWNTYGTPQDEFLYDGLCSEEGDLYATEDGREDGVPFDQTSQTGWQSLLDVYDYYLDEYGLDSYDGDGDTLQLRTNVVMETPGNHAFWENFCEAIHIDSGGTSAEYIGHEFGHGVVDDRTGTPEGSHFAAINESFADVLATGIEDDWVVIGRDASVDRRYSSDWDPGGEEHANSRVPTHAWWLVAHGDGDDIVGIGGNRTRELVLTTLSMMADDISMHDLEDVALFAAIMRGYGSDDRCTVVRSWRRVMGGSSSLPGCQYADADGDGTPDRIDDCDGSQGVDTDHDGESDPCDGDDDGDGVDDGDDHCPTTPDPQNRDLDGDGIGDACDPDRDGDGFDDDEDSCPNVPNPQQRDPGGNPNSLADQDFDGIDDACDPLVDTDGDGHANGEDNCTYDWNEDQSDVDGDGAGDACEIDTDGDGIEDLEDVCSLVADPDQANADGDLLGDACDPCPAGEDQVIASLPPHDPDGPGGIPPIGGSSVVLNDEDGDGIADGCDLGDILQVTGLGTIRAVNPLGGVGGTGEQTFDLPPPCGSDDTPAEVVVTGLSTGARAGLLGADGRVLSAPPPGAGGGFTLLADVRPGATLLLVITGGGSDQGDGPTAAGERTVVATAEVRYTACEESGDDPFPPTRTFVPVPEGDDVPTTAPDAPVATTSGGGSASTLGTVRPTPTIGTVPPVQVGPTTTRPRLSTTTVPCIQALPQPGQTTTTRPPGAPCTTTTTRPVIGTVPPPTVATTPPPTFGTVPPPTFGPG